MSLTFRVHAVQRMFERRIAVADVRSALETGELIEDYAYDAEYPGRLMLGQHGTRPLHVVAVDGPAHGATIVVTVYEPDEAQWQPDFKRRRR